MNRKIWQQYPIGALFAFLFSVSTIGALVTGWNLTTASVGRLLFWCGLFSVLSAVLFFFRYGWCGILLLSVCGAFALWQDGAVWEQMESFACRVSWQYRSVYGWPVIGSRSTSETDLVLILSAYLAALGVSFCICCRKHSIIALPPVILPLVLCLLTTDTLPDERYLFFLMLGIILLLVTDWVRRKNPRQFASHTLRTLVPTAAALALVFALNPQETYVNHAAELQKKALDWFGQVQSTAETMVSENITGSFAFKTLNLRNVGPKSDFTYTVMRVTASFDGAVYLRGRDYNIYNGTAWESSGGRKETFPAGADIFGNLTIHTSGLGNVMYIPYYSTEEYLLADGFVKNSGNTKKYSFTTAKNPVGIASDVSACTELPHETYAWASVLVEGIDTGQPGRAAGAQSIAAYVRSSASYALTPPVMDTAYNDFAEWFLTESDTGYCVHFATAAAVLLRAAGIPARYVEGYMISCQAGEQITVTNQDAHAWVEYYDSDANVWRILEATPAAAAVSDAPAETEEDTAETEAPAPEQTPEQSPEGQENEESTPDTGKTENADGNRRTDTAGNAEITDAGTGNPDGMGGNAAGAGEKIMPEEPLQIPAWVKNLVWIPAALAVIPLQGNIRIAIKRRIWNRGTPNEAALVRWRQSVRLARLTKTELPGVLDALALKAKFSQHTLTGQELDAFSVFRRQILDTVNRMPWYRRYFLRWILAVG